MIEGKTYVIKKRGGGEKHLAPGKYYLDRDTPVGDDACLYELKPYGGMRYIPWSAVIREYIEAP